MPDHATEEVLPADLADHRAVQAWNRIAAQPFRPERIEILKLKSKSAVYRLTGAGPNPATIIAKRSEAGTASVERAVYEELLPRLPLPALHCHGFAPEPDGQHSWLFVEDAGPHTYSPMLAEHRVLAGQWLGAMHRAPVTAALRARLPDRGPGHHLKLLRAGRAALLAHIRNPVLPAEDAALFRTVASHCDTMEANWNDLEEFFAGWPGAVVHGDFVAKNLRIRNGTSEPMLLVYDWEMAGWGVPASDLAQQLGRCASPDLDAYSAALGEERPPIEVREIQRAADFGRVVRMVDKIYWETLGMEGDSYIFFARAVTTLKEYEPQVAAILRAVNWSHHD